MLNIVVPMAGWGSRFARAGFTLPKPLIPVLGRPMIEFVSDNLRPRQAHRFIYIVLKEQVEQFQLDARLKQWSPGSVVIPISGVTEGAACTVLLAEQHIDNADPLMIANCDQWVGVDINDYLQSFRQSGLDGYIMTMKADDPKWSYIRFAADGSVCEVVEKQVVSPEATVGIYNYRHGRDFVAGARRMIAGNLRVNGEFYVAPAYNELLAAGLSLGCYNIGEVGNGMYGLGIPEDLADFEQLAARGLIPLRHAA
jgi:NDP-sugar pyrophosphorylase family protein